MITAMTETTPHRPGEVYYSCEWLEGGIAFSPRGLYHCCIVHHGRHGWPFITAFEGGDLPLETIQAARRVLIARNQEGGWGPCRGCTFLEKKAWEENAYPFTMINLSHFTQCNLRCSYCYLYKEMTADAWWNDPDCIEKGKRPLDLYPVFQSMLERDLISPEGVILWGGGECALLKDFEKLLTLLIDGGLRNNISTNATVFSAAIRDGLVAGKVNLTCSVDAGTRETYALVKGKDVFERVWENLDDYAATGGEVYVKYLFIEENSNDADIMAFVRRAREINATRIICDTDAFDAVLTKKITTAVSVMRYEAERAGIPVMVQGCGEVGFPEKEVVARSDRTMKNIVFTAGRKVRDFFSGTKEARDKERMNG